MRHSENSTQVVLSSVAKKNHGRLTFGTLLRSSSQWDVWKAIFGVQGLIRYPLEFPDGLTGEIYAEADEYSKHMDLADHIVSNSTKDRNFGEILSRCIFIYVDTWDYYSFNEGVVDFRETRQRDWCGRIRRLSQSCWRSFSDGIRKREISRIISSFSTIRSKPHSRWLDATIH